MSSYSFGNVAHLKTVGVAVYADQACTQKLYNISWGILEPGHVKNVTVYVRNEGNVAEILSMYVENWNPQNVSDWLLLTWDANGEIVQPEDSATASFNLAVDASIPHSFKDFSFDIVVVGVEQ
jgi:hypothetical protein